MGKNIKFGQQPANALPVKKANSEEASSEEGPLGPKPMDTVAWQDTVPLDTDSKVSLLQGDCLLRGGICHPRQGSGG